LPRAINADGSLAPAASLAAGAPSEVWLNATLAPAAPPSSSTNAAALQKPFEAKNFGKPNDMNPPTLSAPSYFAISAKDQGVEKAKGR
jgi:hypothetical protein